MSRTRGHTRHRYVGEKEWHAEKAARKDARRAKDPERYVCADCERAWSGKLWRVYRFLARVCPTCDAVYCEHFSEGCTPPPSP